VPLLRCTHCHEESNESRIAIDSDCMLCEEGTLVEVDGWDDDVEAGSEPVVKTEVGAGPQLAIARAGARKIHREFKITAPPVDVEALARRVGFQLAFDVALGSLSGRLRGKRIEIAPCGFQRRRFMIAHELGHHFLGKPHESGPHVETEVNAFAGELLVPGPWLKAALAETTETGALAQRFKVSEQVLEIAAKNHRLRSKLT
jgi:hypothetical protein